MKASTVFAIVFVFAALVIAQVAVNLLNSGSANPISFQPQQPQDCRVDSSRRIDPDISNMDQSWEWAYDCGDYAIEIYLYRYNSQSDGKEATAVVNSYARANSTSSSKTYSTFKAAYYGAELDGYYVAEWFLVDGKHSPSVITTKMHEILALISFKPIAITRVMAVVATPGSTSRLEPEKLQQRVEEIQVLLTSTYIENQ